MNIKQIYSELVFQNIDKHKSVKENQIFVILGQATLINLNNRENAIADLGTFNLEKNEQVFNKEWFANIFSILNQKKATDDLVY